MFSSNSNEKSALRRFLKSVDKKGRKSDFCFSGEDKSLKDMSKTNSLKEVHKKEMHVYLPSLDSENESYMNSKTTDGQGEPLKEI